MKHIKALLAEFRGGTGLKGQLLRGGVWSLAIKLLSTFTALLCAVVLARVLGAEGFGIYSFVFALVSILAVPAQMGLPNLVVRETATAQVAERWDLMKGLWRWASLTALVMSLALMAIGGAVAFLYADDLGDQYAQTLWWGLLLVPMVALGNLRGAALRGLRKVVQGQLPEFVLRPVFLVIFVLSTASLAVGPLAPQDAMKWHVAAAAAAFAIGAWLLLHARPSELVAEKRVVIHRRAWLGTALSLGLIDGLDILNQNIGILILGLLTTPDQVSYYRVAFQASLLITLAHQVAKLVSAPFYSRLYASGDYVALQKMVTVIARTNFIGSIITSGVLLIVGRPLISLIFGDAYILAFLPLVFLMVGQSILSFYSPAMSLLVMTGNERHAIIATALSLVVMTLGTTILGPALQATGVAISVALSTAVSQIYMWRSVKSRLGINCAALRISHSSSSAPRL